LSLALSSRFELAFVNLADRFIDVVVVVVVVVDVAVRVLPALLTLLESGEAAVVPNCCNGLVADVDAMVSESCLVTGNFAREADGVEAAVGTLLGPTELKVTEE